MRATSKTHLVSTRFDRAAVLRRGGERRRARGVVAVEYALVLTFVAVPFVLGMIVAGAGLVHLYAKTRNNVSHAYP